MVFSLYFLQESEIRCPDFARCFLARFETLSDGQRVDCNFDVPGFKIYGDFSNSEVSKQADGWLAWGRAGSERPSLDTGASLRAR